MMESVPEHSKLNCHSDDDNDEIQAKKPRLDLSYKLTEHDSKHNVITQCDYNHSEIEFNVPKVDTTGNEFSTNASLREHSQASTSQDESEIIDYCATLNSLSDDVLLILLSYLNSSDLFYLSLCSRRFYCLCRDRTLWYRVIATCDGTCPSHAHLPSYFHRATAYMRFSKKTRSSIKDLEDTCFGDEYFGTLRHLPNLKTFILENHVLSAQTFQLKFLPESITELRLTGTQIQHLPPDVEGNGFLFFSNVNVILPNLEIVDVSYCQWFHPQLLLPLAKCTKLKILKMIGCRHMKDFIPYASLAAAFGYHGLETLDMRLTDVVDREIGCFNKIKSLKHIFLEKPEDTTESDEDESITDICATSLGMRNWHPTVPIGRAFICPVPKDGGSYEDYTLETLVVRNYRKITDITLKHAEKCLKSLKYLDVTGCSCSTAQIAVFKNNRPEVKLIYGDVAA